MANQHEGWLDRRALKQEVEFMGFLPHRARRRTKVAPGQSGAIVRAHPSEASDLRQHKTPVEGKITRARHQDIRRTALPAAVDVQPVSADVDELACRRRCEHLGTTLNRQGQGPEEQEAEKPNVYFPNDERSGRGEIADSW